jgi:hypothetical protein
MKNPQVKKTFLPQDIAVLAVIFAAGAACFLLGEGWGGLGVVILLCGAMMLPFYRHGYRLEDRKGLYRLQEISLPRDNKAEILAYLEGKLETLDLHSPQPGGALVEVYYRKDEDLRLAPRRRDGITSKARIKPAGTLHYPVSIRITLSSLIFRPKYSDYLPITPYCSISFPSR